MVSQASSCAGTALYTAGVQRLQLHSKLSLLYWYLSADLRVFMMTSAGACA